MIDGKRGCLTVSREDLGKTWAMVVVVTSSGVVLYDSWPSFPSAELHNRCGTDFAHIESHSSGIEKP